MIYALNMQLKDRKRFYAERVYEHIATEINPWLHSTKELANHCSSGFVRNYSKVYVYCNPRTYTNKDQ